MNGDIGVLAFAVLAGALFCGGLLIVVSVLVMLHYVVHNRRVSEQNACFQKIRELQEDIRYQKARVERMESLVTSTVIRLAEMAKIVAIAAPGHGEVLKDMMDSLVKLFHEQVPQAGLSIDAEGNVTIGGDAVGRDKSRRVEYAAS